MTSKFDIAFQRDVSMKSNEKMQIVHYLVLYFIYEANCEEGPSKSKNILPYFRRQVEEVSDDLHLQRNITDDTHGDLVSFFIKNVKEIYNEIDETNTEVCTTVTEPIIYYSNATTVSDDVVAFEPTISGDLVNETLIFTIENNIDIDSVPIEFETLSDDIANSIIKTTEIDSVVINIRKEDDLLSSYKNVTLVSLSDKELINMEHSTKSNGLVRKQDFRDLSKNLLLFETDHSEQDQKPEVLTLPGTNTTMYNVGFTDKSLSCIFCNNVDIANCNDPKNQLIPSMVCENDNDLCYSMHTPFGVIDRGCFNINNNLTTYVCSCNLCNYIAISEMPYLFARKQDWVDNVIELSRIRNFRHSVSKEMSCLRCEANSSAKNTNLSDDSNCLAGNIGRVPTEFCDYNEVCAVKSIRKYGYIWRGCIKFPLFNYWYSLCDTDLCNYDVAVSIYDTKEDTKV